VLKECKLDNFESQPLDVVFLGYALHSRPYHVLNFETNRIVETYEVTFNETMPCIAPVFEGAGEKEMSESSFVEEEQNDANCGDQETTPLATLVEPTHTTLTNRPSATTSNICVIFESVA
jgi:hypothetical protein